MAPALLAALREPFAARALERDRQMAAVRVAMRAGPGACVEALAPLEPNVPLETDFLLARRTCFLQAGHPLARQAGEDLEAWLRP